MNFFSLVDKPSFQISKDLNASPFLMQFWVGENQKYPEINITIANKAVFKFLR